MRLLFIANDFPNPLNPTKAVFNLNLVRALSRKHQVHVISPISWVDEWRARSSEGAGRLSASRREKMDGVTVDYPRYYYPPKIMRSAYGWFYWRSISASVRSSISEFKPEAVLAYWVHPDGEAAVRAGKLAGVRSSVIVGGSDVLLITHDAARKRRVVNVLQGLDSVVTVNQDLKTRVQELGINADKIHVWSQGVDDGIFFLGDKGEARKKLGIGEDGPNLLWVGRMVPVKGLEILVEACAKLKAAGRKFRLFLVGDGPLRSQLEADCAAKGLSDLVKFVGSQQPCKLGDWYRAADLFVLSSWSEGLPNVLRESLACGTPFVASRVGGIGEIAGDSNRLFPAGDAQALADQIAASLESGNGVPKDKLPATWAQSADALASILSCASAR